MGDRVSRIPDGETGPRSDWIVWQYPVLNSRPEFAVCPPGDHPYRSLPRLRLRSPEQLANVTFGELGYAAVAASSYQSFVRLKRDGVVPEHCRLQVSLPTPISPISAFIAHADQASIEPLYERRLLDELEEITRLIPHDQLAVQWDANFEFAMLDGTLPAWFGDVRAGIVERLLRLASRVPSDVQLGYHFCHGHDRHYGPVGRDVRIQVEVANALAGALTRPLNWLHLPLPTDRIDAADYESLGLLRLAPATELYLGLLSLDDKESGANARMSMARRFVEDFGVATVCGWGRLSPDRVPELFDLHSTTTRPLHRADRAPTFTWPEDFQRVPDDDWSSIPLDDSALAYDRVESHSWYDNLDPTVEELARVLSAGGVMVDYSGGTGILLERLKLRVFGTRIGAVIVDSSPKFLRVALEKFRDDPTVAFRHLKFLRGEGRLQSLDEVLGESLGSGGVDVIASTNAIHLYSDLPDTVNAWVRTLKPGGTILINSGNIRNPRAREDQWILDETVWVIGDLAAGIVRTDEGYAQYRPALDNEEQMKEHATFRDRVFLEPRPLSFYVETLESAGLRVDSVREGAVQASVSQWFEFLCAYHDAVLGWVGGTDRVNGRPPSADAVRDRMLLIRQAIDLLFGQRDTFEACWTYLTCSLPG